MIAFKAFHYYTSHLDDNSLRRMATDSHYCRSIDRCDDSSGSATYDYGDGCRGLDRAHDYARDHCAHDYCGDEYYFGNYWKNGARASYYDDHLRCYYFHRPDYANRVLAASLSVD